MLVFKDDHRINDLATLLSFKMKPDLTRVIKRFNVSWFNASNQN